ncbi:MAG: dehydrogenase [Candidatus Omnitrophica bacterium]|nr:dehydrogenase [Candidatus Omnitrophota bacterium]
MCDVSPAILVNDTLVGPVNPEEVEAIIKACKEGGVLPNAYTTKATKRDGKIIFSKVEAYVGLKKALDCGFDAVIKEISESNMRGRGGAGFTTGLKWKLAAEKQSDVKFVICNADEGEPGTFKDRVLLVEYAQTLFEGMVIAGYAIGATEGILYLRGEYGAFKPALEDMLEKMRQENALGNNIFGKEFNFDIKIHLGSGAYICGEETALIESLEGSRGEPRNRPPFPVNTGYNGHPTVVNNVETLIAVVHIIAKGASCFKEIGTPNSSGTKIISVSGDCKKPGVYEIEFGTSIVDILSMVGADDTKAVQVGGASGTCITKDEFKRKIAFEDLSTGGSIMIFNKTRNMLDIADNFLAFFAEESCGQCTPCREGIPVLQERLKMIQENNCDEDEFKDLFSLTETMADASKCGLGQTAPKALCDIIEKFNNEYTLLKDKKEKEIYG